MKRIDRWLVSAGLDPKSLRKMRAAALASADAKKDRPEADEAIGKDRRPKPPAKFGRNNNELSRQQKLTARHVKEHSPPERPVSPEGKLVKLIAITGEPTHPRPCVSPARRVGSPVVVEGRAHASTGI
jgi:hypothetical protein